MEQRPDPCVDCLGCLHGYRRKAAHLVDHVMDFVPGVIGFRVAHIVEDHKVQRGCVRRLPGIDAARVVELSQERRIAGELRIHGSIDFVHFIAAFI